MVSDGAFQGEQRHCKEELRKMGLTREERRLGGMQYGGEGNRHLHSFFPAGIPRRLKITLRRILSSIIANPETSSNDVGFPWVGGTEFDAVLAL